MGALQKKEKVALFLCNPTETFSLNFTLKIPLSLLLSPDFSRLCRTKEGHIRMLNTSQPLSQAAVGVVELALLVLALVSHQYFI